MPKTMRFPLFPWQPGYPPTWRGRYARLNKVEQDLMTTYLALAGEHIAQLWYDVRTDGNPDHMPPKLPEGLTDDPAIARMWWHQNAKRMDAIALQNDRYHIIELRDVVGPQTLGELVQYQTLARAQWPNLPWGETILVTHNADMLILRVLKEHGFTVYQPPTGAPK